MKLKKEFILILLILLLGAFLRLFKVGEIPPGVTLDEMGYIFNSYSIAHTGKNVFGEFFPYLTWMVPNGFPFMPVPIYLSIPVHLIFGLSATSGRLMSSILGIIDIYLLYLLVTQIFKNRTFALLSALFLAISPWHLHFARSAYDHNFALFFYLLGTVLFVEEIKKEKPPILSIASFFLAIFSYRGMSIIALPLFALLFWYGWQVLRAARKQLTIFLVGILLIISSLFFVALKYGDSYTTEGKFIFTNPQIQSDVKKQIEEAEGPLVIRRFFLNKPFFVLSTFRENYLRGYSFDFLFLHTEGSQIYSIWPRGRVYFVDLFFIILGLVFIFKNYKKEALFITGLLLISGLPAAVGGSPFSARNFLMSAVLPIFTTGGILFIYNLKLFKNYKKILATVLILIYGYALSSYLFDYYERYPKIGGEAWGKSFKDLSFKILENKNKYEKIIIGPTTHGDFVEFAFYAKLRPEEVQNVWLKSQRKHTGPFTYKNIYFAPECLKIQETNTLFITPSNCRKEEPVDIIKDSFGNDVWKIYK